MFFRALALAKSCQCIGRCTCIPHLEPIVQQLFYQFKSNQNLKVTSDLFEGIELDDLPIIESIFKVQITVFTLKRNEKASILYQSFKTFPLKLNLCAVKNHFCFIRNLSTFAKCFQCSSCSANFSLKSRLSKHVKTCAKNQSRLIYKGDNFFPPSNIFEDIENETGISVPITNRYFPYRATYDIECCLPPLSDHDSSKIKFTSEHTLMSISVCSNIPGHTQPICMVSDGNTDSLVEKFVLYLEYLSSVAKDLCEKKIC